MKTLVNCGACLAALVLVLGVVALGVAEEKPKPVAPKSDQDFAMMATSAGMFEVESSKLALERAKNDKVKKFAQHMVDDHTKANKELMGLAQALKLTPEQKMSAKHQKEMDKLRDAKEDFDQAYMKAQVKGHEEAVSLFTAEGQGGTNPMLKAWATQTLPTLQMHLRMARETASGLKEKK